jgi:hypothetical protein
MLSTASNVQEVEHQPRVVSCSGMKTYFTGQRKKNAVIFIVPNMFRHFEM